MGGVERAHFTRLGSPTDVELLPGLNKAKEHQQVGASRVKKIWGNQLGHTDETQAENPEMPNERTNEFT